MILKKERPDISRFISGFKKGFDSKKIIECFTEGNCYHFATILKNMYPEGFIYYDRAIGHFIFRYKGSFYDITGKINPGISKLYSWETIKEKEPSYYKKLLLECGYKEYK